VFSNSFSFWLFNLGVSIIWLAVAVTTGNYFMGAGALFYLLFAMVVELPGTSADEGSSDPENESPDDGLSDIL